MTRPKIVLDGKPFERWTSDSKQQILADMRRISAAIGKDPTCRQITLSPEHLGIWDETVAFGTERAHRMADLYADLVEQNFLNGIATQTLRVNRLMSNEIGRLRIRTLSTEHPIALTMEVQEAANTRTVAGSAYVYPPEFFLVSTTYFDINSPAAFRAAVMDEMARRNVDLDSMLVQLLEASTTTGVNETLLTHHLTGELISIAIEEILRTGRPATTLYCPLERFTEELVTSDWFIHAWVPPRPDEFIERGSLGSFIGIDILTSIDPANPFSKDAWMVGGPQTLGGITVRTDLQTAVVDRAAQLMGSHALDDESTEADTEVFAARLREAFSAPDRFGIFSKQILGVAITAPQAVQRIQFI